MSRIRKCDRCSETYEPYTARFNSVGISTFNMDNELEDVSTDFDLCPKCAKEFESWLNAYGKVIATN